MGRQLEQFVAGLELPAWAAGLATSLHAVLGLMGDVPAMGTTIAADLAADGGGAAVQQEGDPALAPLVQQADLDRGALYNADFVIRHGNTLPKRSGVALRLCRHRVYVKTLKGVALKA